MFSISKSYWGFDKYTHEFSRQNIKRNKPTSTIEYQRAQSREQIRKKNIWNWYGIVMNIADK